MIATERYLGDLGDDEPTSSDSDDVMMSSLDPRDDLNKPKALMMDQKSQQDDSDMDMALMLYNSPTGTIVVLLYREQLIGYLCVHRRTQYPRVSGGDYFTFVGAVARRRGADGGG